MNTLTILRRSAVLLTAILGAAAVADTIELADGTVLEGDFVGSSNGVIMFNPGDGIEAYPEKEVVGVYFSSGVASAQMQAAAPATTTVPAGTQLVVRISETIDTKRHGAGHRFRGQLEGALVVNGETVAPRGTFVYGTIAAASQAGNVAGSSNLSLEFTAIMLEDQLFPIATSSVQAQTAGEGGRTLGRSARAAAIGGLIDGRSGARTGAKIGAGVSILTSGASINVPSGTILETTLRPPLTIQ